MYENVTIKKNHWKRDRDRDSGNKRNNNLKEKALVWLTFSDCSTYDHIAT